MPRGIPAHMEHRVPVISTNIKFCTTVARLLRGRSHNGFAGKAAAVRRVTEVHLKVTLGLALGAQSMRTVPTTHFSAERSSNQKHSTMSKAAIVILVCLGAIATASAAGAQSIPCTTMQSTYCSSFTHRSSSTDGHAATVTSILGQRVTVLLLPPAPCLCCLLLLDYRFIGRTTAPGNDINCNQKDYNGKVMTYCKICGGVAAVADACDSNPQ